jgi:hypothetical protein
VSSSVALQRFESVSRGQPEVLKTARLVDGIELPTDDGHNSFGSFLAAFVSRPW